MNKAAGIGEEGGKVGKLTKGRRWDL